MDDGFDETEAGFSREALIEAIRRGGGAYGKREIARALKLSGDQNIHLKRALRALEAEGAIQRHGRRQWRLAESLPGVMVVEVHDRDPHGELLARPVKDDLDARIRLAPGEGAGGRGSPALGVGDRALVRLAPDGDGGYEARLIKRLGQSAHAILCVLRKRAGEGPARLIPVDRRARNELLAAKGEAEKARDGQLVLARISAERRYGLRSAQIVEVLGDADAPGAGSVIALHAHGVPTGFSDGEMKEAKAIKSATLKGREDLRDIPLITIDPEDARDYDDAVWAAPDEDPANKGGWVVMVAIADVAAYVRPGSALDRGAVKRGNSVYLPDRVIHMLPERLSSDLLSLRPKEDRPCLAVRMIFDKAGNKRGHAFTRGMMRSAARLTYTRAQLAIDGGPDDETETLLEPVLKPLWGAYAALKAARERREPLEIDAPERRVRVGEDGRVLGVETRQRFDAHKLIEEFMIQANVCAAETLESKRTPLIYRAHEPPSSEKLAALSDYLSTIGMKWTLGETPRTGRFNRLLAQAKGGAHYETVNEVVLRTQSQAVYSVDNPGHYGLNLRRYAHFTSPIRRYADLTVHRALIRALKLGDDGQTGEEASQLESIAQDISTAERRAMAAERDATDRFIALYMAERVGGEFTGRVTGVTRFGLFVRLDDTGADGLAPISSLGDEYFRYDERAHALVGERSGALYRLGLPVMVKITEAAPVTGGLLLKVLTPPEPGPRGGRRGSGRPQVRGRKGGRRRR